MMRLVRGLRPMPVPGYSRSEWSQPECGEDRFRILHVDPDAVVANCENPSTLFGRAHTDVNTGRFRAAIFDRVPNDVLEKSCTS